MRHFTRVAPIMPASIQAAAYADAEILFDWHKIEGIKGCAITGIQAVIRGTNGADQAAATTVGMDLFFATSHIPTPNDGVNVSIDVVPPTLGTTGAAVDTPGWFNNLVGYGPIVAVNQSDGDLVYLNMAAQSDLSIPIGADVYVAAISKGAFDFRTTVTLDESGNHAAGAATVITVADRVITPNFAPGDIIHAVDDAVVGTIKTVDSDTQFTLTKANVDALTDDDVLYNVTPIQFIITSED